jgi:hypothetical protein
MKYIIDTATPVGLGTSGMLAEGHLPLLPSAHLQQGVHAQVAHTLISIRTLGTKNAGNDFLP